MNRPLARDFFDGSPATSPSDGSSSQTNLSSFGNLIHSNDLGGNIKDWILAFSQKSQNTGSNSVLISLGGSLVAAFLILIVYAIERTLRDGKLLLNPVDVLDDDIRRHSRDDKEKPADEKVQTIETSEKYGKPYGLDSKAYRNINRTCTFITFAEAIPAVCLLLADVVYNVGGKATSSWSFLLDWSQIFSIQSAADQRLLWAHFAYGIFVSLAICIGCLGSMYGMIHERDKYFKSKEGRPSWLMFTGGLETWKQELADNGIWHQCLDKVKPGIKLKKRHKKTLAFNKMVRHLERCGTAYSGLVEQADLASGNTRQVLLERAKKQLKEFVKRVENLDKEFQKLERMDIDTSWWSAWKCCFAKCCLGGCCCFRCTCLRTKNRKFFAKEANQSKNYGFLLFRDHQAARFHLKRLLLADQPWWQRMLTFFYKANVEIAPDEEAICYVGINRHRAIRWWDTLKSLALTALAVCLYTIVIIMISGLANLQDYVPQVAWLQCLWNWQIGSLAAGRYLITAVAGIVPPSLAYSARYLLVPAFRRFAFMRGTNTFPSRDEMIFVWLFAVLIVCHLMCFSLLGVLQSTIQAVWRDWVESGFKQPWNAWAAIEQVPEKVVQATVGSANYWLSSLGLQCCISAFTIVEPVRVFQLKFLPWLRGHEGITQREKRQHREPSSEDFPIVKDSANFMLMQAVITAYSMITPLVTIVGLLANLIHMKTTTTRLKNVHRTRGEGQGHLYLFWINRLLFCAGVIQPTVVAMALYINVGWKGMLIPLGASVFVLLFKLEMSYAAVSNLLAGRSRHHWAGWSLEDTLNFGSDIKDLYKDFEKMQHLKLGAMEDLEGEHGYSGQDIDAIEGKIKRLFREPGQELKDLMASAAEEGKAKGFFSLFKKKKDPITEEHIHEWIARDVASKHAQGKASKHKDEKGMSKEYQEILGHLIVPLVAALAMESKLQPIDIDNPQDCANLPHSPKDAPNFLRPTKSCSECPLRDKHRHKSDEACRKVCRINVFMERPAFTEKDYGRLERGFCCFYPILPIPKWTRIYRNIRLSSIGDLGKQPLQLVRAEICNEPIDVKDSKARPPSSQ